MGFLFYEHWGVWSGYADMKFYASSFFDEAI